MWLVVLAILAAVAPKFQVGGNIAIGLVCALAAVALLELAFTINAHRAIKLIKLFRPWLIIVLLIPLVWSLLQAAPLPGGMFSDPVWASTSAALKRSIASSISVDVGATLLSNCEFCAVLAVGFVTVAVSSEPHSAGKIPYLLCVLAGIVGGIQLYFHLGPHAAGSFSANEGSTLADAVGVIVACSLLINLRRRVSRTSSSIKPAAWTTLAFAIPTAVFILCTSSLALAGEARELFIALFCAAVPLSIFAIHRLSLSWWGRSGIAAGGAILLIGFFALASTAEDAPRHDGMVTRNVAASMLSNAPLFGHGAGTFQDIAPAYGGEIRGFMPRNAAAVIATEMGYAFLWVYIVVLALGSALLVRNSLIRTRGYIHLATGAAILLAVLLLSFIDPDVLSLPDALLASSTLGFALVHTRSKEKARSTPLRSPEAESRIIPVQVSHSDERVLRLACGLGAFILATQGLWVLGPEAIASRELSAVTSAGNTADLDRAASLAAIRGDLWAKCGLVRAGLSERNGWHDGSAQQARVSLVNALRFSPYDGPVWLTLARLADQFGWSDSDPAALLKMSYYTAATDAELLPATLKLALRLPAIETDIELQDVVRRDIELVLLRFSRFRPALAEAFEGASGAGKALAEQVIAQLDPTFLKSLRRQ
jgi:hypothetical protein